MLLHTAFLQRAGERPERPALICQDQQLSYGALERRANTVAAHLIARGVRPDDRVSDFLPDVDFGEVALDVAAAFGLTIPPDDVRRMDGSFDALVRYLAGRGPVAPPSAPG